MVKIKKKLYNSVFFVYNLQMQKNIYFTIEINNMLTTFTPLTIAANFLSNKTKAAILN